jgi:hypothetical protein
MMKRIFLAGLMAIAFIAPSYGAITNDDIQQAAKMYCNSLKSGQSKEDAAKVADDYLSLKVNKGETVSFGEIRKQMRQSILNICPNLVKQ